MLVRIFARNSSRPRPGNVRPCRPVSADRLSVEAVQERLIRVSVAALAVRFVGAVGGVGVRRSRSAGAGRGLSRRLKFPLCGVGGSASRVGLGGLSQLSLQAHFAEGRWRWAWRFARSSSRLLQCSVRPCSRSRQRCRSKRSRPSLSAMLKRAVAAKFVGAVGGVLVRRSRSASTG